MTSWMTTLWSGQAWPMAWCVVLAACAVAAAFDVKGSRIPNRLTGPMFLLGLAWAGASAGWLGLADAMAGCLLAGVPFVAMYALGGAGAGDAKLMGAMGAWVGVTGAAACLMTVILTGGLLALLLAAYHGRLWSVLGNTSRMFNGLLLLVYNRGASLNQLQTTLPRTADMRAMPYGVAIFLGVGFAAIGAGLWHV